MAAFHCDDSHWPLFRISVTSSAMNDAEFMAFLATVDGLPLRGNRFAMLVDVRVAEPLSAQRRRIIGKHVEAFNARHPGAMVGTAIVMSSAIWRGVFTAINWLLRHPQKIRAFTTIAEAEAWLRAELREPPAPAPLPGRE